MSKPEAAGSTPKKRPQEGTPRKKAQGEGTFVFRVNPKRAKAAKIAMVDAARIDLPVAVRGGKWEDAGDLANTNKQAGHSPLEATARGILAKSGRWRPVDESGSNEEKAGGSVSKPEAVGSTPKNWPQEGTPRKQHEGKGPSSSASTVRGLRRQRLQWWMPLASTSRSW